MAIRGSWRLRRVAASTARALDPTRLGPVRRVVRAVRPHGVVLMYHRVAKVDSDVFGLVVSPENFAQQAEVLSAFRPLHMTDLVDASRRRSIPRRAVAVTFDDGYADNHSAALPVLRRTGIPATMYIVTSAVGGADEFWWDQLEHLALSTAAGEVTVGERRFVLEGPRAQRLEVLGALHRALLGLPPADQQDVLDRLAATLGVPRPRRDQYRAMTVDEFGEVARDPLVEIGAHTVTHAHLPSRTDAEIRLEFDDSRAWLSERVGEVRSVSYPYGAYDERVARIASRSGFTSGATIDPITVGPGADPMRIGRFAVGDWDGEVFERRLSELFGS